ncbi:MAG: hypothetical protein ABIA21_04235 [Candidatus Aenigmatarchaeota archaeon]
MRRRSEESVKTGKDERPSVGWRIYEFVKDAGLSLGVAYLVHKGFHPEGGYAVLPTVGAATVMGVDVARLFVFRDSFDRMIESVSRDKQTYAASSEAVKAAIDERDRVSDVIYDAYRQYTGFALRQVLEKPDSLVEFAGGSVPEKELNKYISDIRSMKGLRESGMLDENALSAGGSKVVSDVIARDAHRSYSLATRPATFLPRLVIGILNQIRTPKAREDSAEDRDDFAKIAYFVVDKQLVGLGAKDEIVVNEDVMSKYRLDTVSTKLS